MDEVWCTGILDTDDFVEYIFKSIPRPDVSLTIVRDKVEGRPLEYRKGAKYLLKLEEVD